MATALESLPKASAEELIFISQGFRDKQNKGLVAKIRKTIIDRKKHLFASESKHHDLINLFFTFASNRPKSYGVYKVQVADQLDEMLAHFEHDLCEAAESADSEHLTRLAQTMYLLKTGEFENIWWRIENRANDLNDQGKLDIYHVTNLTRAFSHAQNNRMCGTNKTFSNLEPVVIAGLDKVSDRDASHLMYAYSVREAGNPALY